MIIETELLVLKAIRYSDSSSIVHTYSKELGSISYKVARTSRKRSGSVRAFFMPLSHLKVEMNYFPNREVQVAPKEVELLYLPSQPSYDPVANAVALFMTEVLHRLLRVEQGESDIFEFIIKMVRRLDTLPPAQLPSLHLQFLVELTHHLGILPRVEGYQKGYILSFDAGSFEPISREEDALWREASEILVAFIHSEEPCAMPLNKVQRNAVVSLLLDYITYHYPNLGTIRSPEVLSTLFSS